MRRLIPLIVILMMCLSAGCRRHGINTFSRVCAHLSPVQIQSLNPVQVETKGPVRVEAQIVPTLQPPLEQVVVQAAHFSSEKIAVIDVDGLLVNQEIGSPLSGTENPVALFREKLDQVRADKDVRAVVLRINSSGGGVTASDIMRRELDNFSNDTQLPIVASIMDVGTGGAYYLATAADEIMAHPTSVIGGIGVILNLYNLEDALTQFNIVGVPVKSGKHVDLGSPLRKMPDESREILQEIADDFHERFQGMVRSSREGLTDDKTIFDGRVLTSESAKRARLIDSVGYLEEAIERAESLGNCKGAAVVMLQRSPNSTRTEYDLTSLQQRLFNLPQFPGLDRSRLPTFLYIWQPDPSLTSGVGG